MTKVKFFNNTSLNKLEKEVNEFLQHKVITNISYTTQNIGVLTKHCCVIMYNTMGK